MHNYKQLYYICQQHVMSRVTVCRYLVMFWRRSGGTCPARRFGRARSGLEDSSFLESYLVGEEESREGKGNVQVGRE